MNSYALKVFTTIKAVIAQDDTKAGYPDWHGINELGLPKVPGAQSGVTWCNRAADRILNLLGYNMDPVLHTKGILYSTANTIHDTAAKASTNPETGVIEISPNFAQHLANKGYGILVTAKNLHGSGHVGVVCPDDNVYDAEAGPFIGQAGAVNGIRTANKSFVGLTVPRYYILPRRA